MSLFSRIKRMWELSATEDHKEMEEFELSLPTEKEVVVQREKLAVFIPRIVKDPVDAIVNEPKL